VVDEESHDTSQGHEGALAALLEVSQLSDIVEDYRTIAGAFDNRDYQTIIDLAWRNQFNDERLNFKREIRELQQFISQRILHTQEASE
jgi:hypothetical protein